MALPDGGDPRGPVSMPRQTTTSTVDLYNIRQVVLFCSFGNWPIQPLRYEAVLLLGDLWQ